MGAVKNAWMEQQELLNNYTIDELQSEVDNIANEISGIEDEISDKQDQLDELQQEFESNKNEIARLESEIDQEIGGTTEEEIKDSISELSEANINLNSEIEELSDEITKLNNTLDEKTEELDEKKTKLQELEDYEDAWGEFSSLRRALERDNSKELRVLENKYYALEDTQNKTMYELTLKQKKINELTKYKDLFESIKSKLEKNEKFQLADLEEVKKEIELSEKERNELETKIEEQKNKEKEKINGAIQELTNSLKTMQSTRKKYHITSILFRALGSVIMLFIVYEALSLIMNHDDIKNIIGIIDGKMSNYLAFFLPIILLMLISSLLFQQSNKLDLQHDKLLNEITYIEKIKGVLNSSYILNEYRNSMSKVNDIFDNVVQKLLSNGVNMDPASDNQEKDTSVDSTVLLKTLQEILKLTKEK